MQPDIRWQERGPWENNCSPPKQKPQSISDRHRELQRMGERGASGMWSPVKWMSESQLAERISEVMGPHEAGPLQKELNRAISQRRHFPSGHAAAGTTTGPQEDSTALQGSANYHYPVKTVGGRGRGISERSTLHASSGCICPRATPVANRSCAMRGRESPEFQLSSQASKSWVSSLQHKPFGSGLGSPGTSPAQARGRDALKPSTEARRHIRHQDHRDPFLPARSLGAGRAENHPGRQDSSWVPAGR